jgi:hypothetical protein
MSNQQPVGSNVLNVVDAGGWTVDELLIACGPSAQPLVLLARAQLQLLRLRQG